MKHGASGYRHSKCLCDVCRAGHAARQLLENAARKARNPETRTDITHGADSTYNNHGCRCEPCRSAHSAMMAAYRVRRRQLFEIPQRLLDPECRCDLCRPTQGRHA